MLKAHRRERGQVLVLIILAIVGIMGFAALAVDVGRIYAERRRAQSAADAASMAWAFAAIWDDDHDPATINDDPITAWNSLAKNDYEVVPGRIAITLNHPPASGPYAGDNAYFQVIIQATVDQVFGQFIRPGPYDITVESVAHAAASESPSGPNAIVAMGEDICPGIVFNGGTVTSVDGGNIFSNSNGTGPGSCYSGISTGSSGLITVEGGDVLIAADWQNNGGATIDPPVIDNVGQTTFRLIDPPVCKDTTVRHRDDDPGTLHPGVYNDPVHISNGQWTMEPGMYCFHADFRVNGSEGPPANPNWLMGTDVLIVMYEGSLELGGGFLVDLTRPNDFLDGAGEQYGGMLIYMPYENTGGVDISGNNNTNYSGLIYAPGPRVPSSQEKCNLGGADKTMGLDASVMCYTIGIAGNSILTIDYDPNRNYRGRPSVELSQ